MRCAFEFYVHLFVSFQVFWVRREKEGVQELEVRDPEDNPDLQVRYLQTYSHVVMLNEFEKPTESACCSNIIRTRCSRIFCHFFVVFSDCNQAGAKT